MPPSCHGLLGTGTATVGCAGSRGKPPETQTRPLGRSRLTSAAVPRCPRGFGGPSPSPRSPWVVPESGYPGNIPAVPSRGSPARSTFTRTPQRDPKKFVPSLPIPVPSRGFLGDQDFRRASQAPCAAAPCAGMFSHSRRAAESRIITGNVPGEAAWSRGHLHGPCTALLGPFTPDRRPPRVPAGPPVPVPAWPHTSFRELPRFSRPEEPRPRATAP